MIPLSTGSKPTIAEIKRLEIFFTRLVTKFWIHKNGNLFKGHNDMYFHLDCKNHGFGVYLDPTILCEHKNDTY